MCATDPYLWRVSLNMTDQLLTGFNELSISRCGSHIYVSVHNQCQNVVFFFFFFFFFITAIGVVLPLFFCYMYIYVIQIIKQMKYLTLQFSLVCPTFSIMILQY